jgi:phosphatidylserine decarboxylase
MVKEGFPFVVVPLAIAVVFGLFYFWTLAVIFLLIAGFMAFFFRDPVRDVPSGEGLIVSAADGRITRIEENKDSKLVSIFLSPLDVHINRAPVGGMIESITYVHGKKVPATNDNASLVNERNTLIIQGADGAVTCTQIAGILARRIVCWPKAGDTLERGQRFGLIKFSSRTDITMPASVELEVKVGDRVRGGEKIIGKVKN